MGDVSAEAQLPPPRATSASTPLPSHRHERLGQSRDWEESQS